MGLTNLHSLQAERFVFSKERKIAFFVFSMGRKMTFYEVFLKYTHRECLQASSIQITSMDTDVLGQHSSKETELQIKGSLG